MEGVMKAIRYHKFGSSDVLNIEEVNKPTIEDDELLIEVYATTINSGDCHLRSGKPFSARLFAGPFVPRNKILGSTYSGVIIDIGSSVKKFNVGDRVFGSLGIQSGSHAEYVKTKASSSIIRKPDTMSHEDAASIVFGSLSGKYFLDSAKINANQNILVIGAAGGVGAYAVQYAAALGAHVTGLCSKASSKFVKSLGAKRTIDYRTEKLTDYLNQFDVIFDMVGKEKLSVIQKSLKSKGIYITTVARTDVMIKQVFNKNRDKKYIFGIDKSSVKDLEEIVELVSSRKIRPLIDQVFTLKEFRVAHDRASKSGKSGAVVLTINK